jgi:hypothetical protein
MITVIPVRPLVDEAKKILSERLIPMHYKTLATLAAQRLTGGEEFSAIDIAEDFRGKGKGFPGERCGMFYTGKPDCLVGFRDWFISEQTPMFGDLNFRTVTLPIKNQEVIAAAIESHMRIEFMLNKFNLQKEARFKQVLFGLIVEETVRSFFAERWPEFYKPADNHKKYEDYCDHDFRLFIFPKCYRVDVATLSKRHNDFVKPPGKPTADIHILATMNPLEDTVTIHGYTRGEDYRDHTPKYKKSFDRLACFLNCQKHGININKKTIGQP